MAIYRAKQQFFAGDRVPMIEPGDLYSDDNELVREYPAMFEEVQVQGRRGVMVEAMTANPGEQRRGPGRPRKDGV